LTATLVRGTEWEREIETNLNTADIVLLLVQPHLWLPDCCSSINATSVGHDDAGEACHSCDSETTVDWQNQGTWLLLTTENAEAVIPWQSGRLLSRLPRVCAKSLEPPPSYSAELRDDAIINEAFMPPDLWPGSRKSTEPSWHLWECSG